MYCNHCGTALPAGVQACPNCRQPVPMPQRSRVERHLTVLAVLWFAMGALRLLAAIGLFIASEVVGAMIRAEPIPAFVPHILSGVGVLLLVVALVSLVVGWGLYKRESWGRPVALVMAFLNLLSFPFGTALGIYTLVVLLPREGAKEYEVMTSR